MLFERPGFLYAFVSDSCTPLRSVTPGPGEPDNPMNSSCRRQVPAAMKPLEVYVPPCSSYMLWAVLSPCVLCQCLYVVRDVARRHCFSSLLAERVRCGGKDTSLWEVIYYIFKPFWLKPFCFKVSMTMGHTRGTVKKGTVKNAGPYKSNSF